MSPDPLAGIRAQRARVHRIMIIVIVGFWMVAAVAVIWLFRHPETIGHIFGRIAAGFRAS